MEVGTRFKALRGTPHDVTEGKEYVIAGLDDDYGPYFIDDVGELNFSVGRPDGGLEPYGYEVLS